MLELACAPAAHAGWIPYSGGGEVDAGENPVGAPVFTPEFGLWMSYLGPVTPNGNPEVRIASAPGWDAVGDLGPLPLNVSPTAAIDEEGYPTIAGSHEEVWVTWGEEGKPYLAGAQPEGFFAGIDPLHEVRWLSTAVVFSELMLAWVEYDPVVGTSEIHTRHRGVGEDLQTLAWLEYGSTVNTDPTATVSDVQITSGPQDFVPQARPAVAWRESDASGSRIRVSYFKLDDGLWHSLDDVVARTPGFDVFSPTLQSVGFSYRDDIGLVLTWWENNRSGYDLRVARLDSSLHWEVLGEPLNDIRAHFGGPASISGNAPMPWVAWSEDPDTGGSSSRVRVANWNGVRWTQVADDLNRDPTADAYRPTIGRDPFPERLVVAWTEIKGADRHLYVSELDPDGHALVRFSATAYEVGEADGTATITIQREGGDGEVSVSYESTTGSATPGADYTGVSGEVTFADGETSKTFTVPILDDHLDEGDETLGLRLVAAGGDAVLDVPDAATLTIRDSSSPETTIVGNATATNAGVGSFAFAAVPPTGATFECSWDDEPFAPCTSPHQSGVLDPGNHNFRVRASNANGTDPTPASRDFIVDRDAPTTTIRLDGSQTAPGAFAGSVTVDADVTDPAPSSGIASKFCVVDPPTPPASLGAFGSQPCGVVVTAIGTHVAYAIANDNARNESAIVSATFSIVAAPDTTITDGPSGVVYSVPSFRFTSNVAGARFECRVDSGPYTACSSAILPYKVFDLSQGTHTFEVRAIGPDGLVDPSPASRTFMLGTQALDGGCSFRFPFKGGDQSCVAKRAVCPLGSVCSRAGEVTVVNEDIGISYAGVVSQALSEVVPRGSTTKPLSYNYGCSAPSLPSFTKGPCPGSWSNTVVGTGQAIAVVCGTYPLGNYSGAATPLPGPDEARGIICDGTITIRPATALEAAGTGTGTGVGIVVPGPGILGVAPAAGLARSSAAGRAAATKPPFRTITRKIKGEGVKELKLGLGPAEARFSGRSGGAS
ncbi:MAG: Calx-beta domain-containing protein [Candidatus Binatia bacterium]